MKETGLVAHFSYPKMGFQSSFNKPMCIVRFILNDFLTPSVFGRMGNYLKMLRKKFPRM
jgi:hypothetical protein